MRRRVGPAWFLVAAWAAVAVGQGPAPEGEELQVNTHTTGSQSYPAVATDPFGGFVVVWSDADRSSIAGQRFDDAGAPAGSEFPVSTTAASPVANAPAVSVDAAGGFVVVWESDEDGRIAAQRFASDGSPVGSELRVDADTTSPHDPDVAQAADGSFVVVWVNAPDSVDRIVARRFDGGGSPLGSELFVSDETSSPQSAPRVDSRADGSFVVVWSGGTADGERILGKRFDSSGNPLGSEIQVSEGATAAPAAPDIAQGPDGDFLVVWQETDSGEDAREIVLARRYDSAGAPAGSAFRVSASTRDELAPAVSASPHGGFVVVWHAAGETDYDVFGQALDGAGMPLGDGFRVNGTTANDQRSARLAHGPDGEMVVAWSSYGQAGEGASDDVFLQRYAAAETTPTPGDGSPRRGGSLEIVGRVVARGEAGETVGCGVFRVTNDSGETLRDFAITIDATDPALLSGAGLTCGATRRDVAGSSRMVFPFGSDVVLGNRGVMTCRLECTIAGGGTAGAPGVRRVHAGLASRAPGAAGFAGAVCLLLAAVALPRRRTLLVLAAIATLASGLAACGDDPRPAGSRQSLESVESVAVDGVVAFDGTPAVLSRVSRRGP